MDKPQSTEYAEFYEPYIQLVPEGDVLASLATEIKKTRDLLSELTDKQALHRYAPGKWSVKEVVGHMADGEQVFGYRALRISRGDPTPMEGFEQDDYVAAANFDAHPLDLLVARLEGVRRGNIAMLRAMDPAMHARMGNANGSPVSVRALAAMLIGHERHHRKVLQERYLR